MKSLCGCEKTILIKVEAATNAGPIWCTTCGANLAMDDFRLSKQLVQELINWNQGYGIWMDAGTDILLDNAVAMENAHNKQGRHVMKLLQGELCTSYIVSTYKPSRTVQSYLANRFFERNQL